MSIEVKNEDKDLVRRLIEQLETRLPELVPGRKYQLEQILGPDYWEDEDDSHHALGHAFSNLVAEGRVPFAYRGFTKDRHNNYVFSP